MLRRISLIAAAAMLAAGPALAAAPNLVNDREPRTLTVRTGQGQAVTIVIPSARAEAPYALTGTARAVVTRTLRVGQGNWISVPAPLS